MTYAIPLSDGKFLNTSTLNQHLLILGASGGGKTNTVEYLIQELTKLGVNCLVTDVKGDLSRLNKMRWLNTETDEAYDAVTLCPFNRKGSGVSLKIGSMDAGLIGGLISKGGSITEAQKRVIMMAVGKGTDTYDLYDLHDNITNHYSDSLNNPAVKNVLERITYSIDVLGLNDLFGESDLLNADKIMQKHNNILNCTELVKNKYAYSQVIMQILESCYHLPEVGNQDAPKIALFFDEAHLLFNALSKEQIANLVAIVKLIRSKGVCLCFISQSIDDIDDSVIGQLSTMIHHRLAVDGSTKGRKALDRIDKALNVMSPVKTNYKQIITTLSIGQSVTVRLDKNRKPINPDVIQIPMSVATEENWKPLTDAQFDELYPKVENGVTSIWQKIKLAIFG